MLAAACSNPQGATPIPEPPSIDPSKVVTQVTILIDDPRATLTGQPGATAPRATVRVTNLDNTAPPIETRARADGGFTVALEVPFGNELRLQPVAGSSRGEPLDLLRTSDGAFVESPRHACFRVASGLELTFTGAEAGGETQAVELVNDCEQQASVDSSGTRLGLNAFALGSDLPVVVPAQASATVLVERDSTVTAEQEDVLFLTVTIDGTARRYPITLFAPER